MKNFVNYFLLFSFLIFASCTSAQTPTDTSQTNVHADKALFLLLEKRKAIGIKNMKGYRVKIHFGAEKAKANDMKVKFCQKYPEVPAYLDYDIPNFSITVGNYRTRLDAYKFYKQVQSDFSNAFIVEMKIEFPEITVRKGTPEEENKK